MDFFALVYHLNKWWNLYQGEDPEEGHGRKDPCGGLEEGPLRRALGRTLEEDWRMDPWGGLEEGPLRRAGVKTLEEDWRKDPGGRTLEEDWRKDL